MLIQTVRCGFRSQGQDRMWLSVVSVHKIKMYIQTKGIVKKSSVGEHLRSDTRATLRAVTEAAQAKAEMTGHLTHGREWEAGRPVRISPTHPRPPPISAGRQFLITFCVLMRREAFCPIPSEQRCRTQSQMDSSAVRCQKTHLAVSGPFYFGVWNKPQEVGSFG